MERPTRGSDGPSFAAGPGRPRGEYPMVSTALGAPMRLSRARAGLASLLASLGAVAMGSVAASGSSALPSHFIEGEAGTTITLEGPNQWTQSGSSFGHPWDQVVAEFKKVTGVTVNTDVLPLATFSGVESAQLAAGIAPDWSSTRRTTSRTWSSRSTST